ncbi:B12-binding domain-containing radical SAM protein [Thiocapsa imhoffii]|uniref:B12-binding domain-containing radical SAM protein n=1 Tax=Thiocapsa imhoffii TaxID=382777 RepID=A0A9X0WED8_9GAMM|nr:DUF4080 domain-containing protein [Thiocapsa imhoffii]MBK1643092.1 B12-binding domain-containing radical SAM protein [Thiocapsa imhoffii]
MSSAIVLATLNARYAHASLALRYLRANLGALREVCVLREFVVGVAPEAVVRALLAERPRLIGLSVAIWNVVPLTRVVTMLKAVAPEVVVVLGGPEVSHEVADQEICARADYVVTGWGEVTFARLAGAILNGVRPLDRVLAGEQPSLDHIILPGAEFSEQDLRHRRLYVEASRGCPFRCAFCLSALDRTAWPFPTARVLSELGQLYSRGARAFRFVDRTFNLNLDHALAVLSFFLERLAAEPAEPLFLHFELIPDHLPEPLKAMLAAFPPGTLQLEVGVQSFNPRVQRLIARRQDNARTEYHLRWLRQETHAHLHTDLILGLPGEDVASFAHGFDRLVRLAPHEIQVGLLKRLRGTPITHDAARFGMRFQAMPPYALIANDLIDAPMLQRLVRFARYWDLIGNSGRFTQTLPLLLAASPFTRFLECVDALYARLGTTHGIALERLYEALHAWLLEHGGDPQQITATLLSDYAASGARGQLGFAPERVRPAPARREDSATPARQRRHLRPRTRSNC